jgi:hypothetical protein
MSVPPDDLLIESFVFKGLHIKIWENSIMIRQAHFTQRHKIEDDEIG